MSINLTYGSRAADDIEVKHQHRNPDAWTIRSALRNLSADDVETPAERDMLLKYQDTLRQLDQKRQELDDNRELWSNIHAGNDKNYLAAKKCLDEEAKRIVSQADILERHLIDLQTDPHLEKVIEREKAKAKERWEQKAEQSRKEAEARAKESAEQTERELRERYQKSRQEALQRRAQTQQRQNQEIINESKTLPPPEPKTITAPPKEDPKNERKILDMLTSKRIAAIISLVLCAALYLSFLSAFTTKRDTYICYTTKTGTHFHSATCKYLNTAYETTVYEASKKYKPCNYCNPCIEQYETTITYRNYVIPILISVPISATIFLLLTYKKKKK